MFSIIQLLEYVTVRTGHELIQKSLLNLALLLPLLVLLVGLLGPLLVDNSLLSISKLSSLLPSQGQGIVRLVPKIRQFRTQRLSILKVGL